jgi:antirestriction protein ArdC
MKRDLYTEVSTRIVAELERGTAPWIKPWSATAGMNTPCNAMTNRPYSGCNVLLLWMAQTAGYRTPRFLTFKQALDLGGNVRRGEHGTKVYFVKQLQVRDEGADDKSATRLIPMMREYTVFNVDQCENLPDSINTGKPMRVRNPDTRATGLPTNSCALLARTFVRAMVKPTTCQATILCRCPHSMRSRAQITSTTWHFMN